MRDMKMKKKLVFASKILLGIFFLSLLAVVMSVSYDAESAAGFLLLLFLTVSVLTIIVVLIEFVLEMMEKWKEMGARSILVLLGQMVVYAVVFFICDYLIEGKLENPLRYLVPTAFMVFTTTAISYWKRVRN